MSLQKYVLVAACLLLPLPATAGKYDPAVTPSVGSASGIGSASGKSGDSAAKNSNPASDEQRRSKVSITAQGGLHMPDAVRLCRDALPNVRGVLMCFDQHREQISNRCRTVLASYGLN